MTWPDVTAVLDALDAAEVPAWVAGGWGVDVLHGAQTREHRDLDLLTDAVRHAECLAALTALGYHEETDRLPLRLELAAAGGRWVDVHPVVFDAEGNGVQGDPAAEHYAYPPEVFTRAAYDGRNVPCITAAHQLAAHHGYPPRPQDEHDLAVLRDL